MRQKRINQNKKSVIWPATGKSARYSVKHKMTLLNMLTMITSRRTVRTSPVTGMAARGKGNPLKPNICWLCTCVGTQGRNHINAL